MTRKLKDSVVVITGASSGIGKATARLFASKGAALVLGARRKDLLEELAQECRRMGTQAVAVQVDVSQEDEVQNLARQAIEHYGRIDVWVNNAGVYLLGRFEDSPPDAFRQVIETNLFGYVYGARAALPHMREQGSGVLINNASIFGSIGAPYLSAYVTSKFAVRGLSESLRQEMLDDKDIHICTVLPAAIDTPLFQHSGNYTGRAARPVRPVYNASQVASTIVKLARRPRAEVAVGSAGKLVRIQRRLMPTLSEKTMARQVEIDHFLDEPAAANPGNIFEPVAYGAGVSGGWKAPHEPRPARRFAAGGLVAAVPAFFAWRKLSDSGPRSQSISDRALGDVRHAGKSAVRKVRKRLPV